MDPKEKKIIIKRYTNRFKKFGSNIKTLASGNYKRRKIRFQVLTEIGNLNGKKILDVGCGFADYYNFLKKKNIDIDYTGIDIVPEIIESNKKKYPKLDITLRDIQTNPYPKKSFDYIFASQVMNLKFKNENNLKFAKNIITLMFNASKLGVAIDFLSETVDYKEDHLYYYSPCVLFNHAKKTLCIQPLISHAHQ